MMRWMLLFVLLASPAVAQAQTEACAYDKPRMLAMNLATFDQSPEGWRSVGDRPGCEIVGADLIATYRMDNATKLINGNLSSVATLNWHEAQLLAGAGETQRALVMFHRAHPLLSAPGAGDPLYADATIAFLKRDRVALLRARDNLAALPKPAWYDALAASFKAQTGQAMTWPDNLDVVNGLVACFDKPYKAAYGVACRELGGAQTRE